MHLPICSVDRHMLWALTGCCNGSLLTFRSHGCNFDAMAPKSELNHNRLWKRPLYVVCRPVSRCDVIWAIRQLGESCLEFFAVVLRVLALKIA